MKTTLRILLRVLRGTLMLIGGLGLLYIAMLFTSLPWQTYKRLWTVPNPSDLPPTHILVMGGSGIPGESGLMRTFYAAEAAQQNPNAAVWIAMPLDAADSPASRAYLNEIQLRGIPTNRVRILEGGRNTREQALRLAARLAEDSDAACVMIVTSPEHTRRTAAAIRNTCNIPLTAFPAFPISLEDPLPWRTEELNIPDTATAAQTVIPDIGASMYLRYNLWANMRYMNESFREYAALLYYRLQGWI